MKILGVFGILLILLVLWDAFETVVLPRRVTRRFRLVRMYYRSAWPLWTRAVNLLLPVKRRETVFSFFGPLSLLGLLVLWAVLLIIGFAFLYFAQDNGIRTPEHVVSLGSCIYFSGSSFFTLGLGDVQPLSGLARFLVASEAGLGFGFLAIVISYLPAIYQAFSRRETNISLLDARAGSPPTAAEILQRNSLKGDVTPLIRLFQEWERWTAELLESHLSFPMLAYFRSQHDNQSWLAALTSIMDSAAFVISTFEGEFRSERIPRCFQRRMRANKIFYNLENRRFPAACRGELQCVRQARLTFAIARHAVVDLALVLYAPPVEPRSDRLPSERLAAIRRLLESVGLPLRAPDQADENLAELRALYEPYLHSLSRRLLLPLPPWQLPSAEPDNWQISAWKPKPTVKKHF